MKLKQRMLIIEKICLELSKFDNIEHCDVIKIIRKNLIGFDTMDFYNIKNSIFVFLDLNRNIGNVSIYSVNKKEMIELNLIKGSD